MILTGGIALAQNTILPVTSPNIVREVDLVVPVGATQATIVLDGNLLTSFGVENNLPFQNNFTAVWRNNTVFELATDAQFTNIVANTGYDFVISRDMSLPAFDGSLDFDGPSGFRRLLNGPPTSVTVNIPASQLGNKLYFRTRVINTCGGVNNATSYLHTFTGGNVSVTYQE